MNAPQSQTRCAWMAYLGIVIAILFATSAYPVFEQTVVRNHVPPSVAFAWFTIVAAITSYCIPIRWYDTRITHTTTAEPTPTTWEALSGKASAMLILATLANVAYFWFLLRALTTGNAHRTITTLVILELEPIATTIVAYAILGDTCRSWTAFLTGAFLTAGGAAWYSATRDGVTGASIADRTVPLALMVIASHALLSVTCARARRAHHVHAIIVERVIELLSIPLALCLVAMEGASLAVPWETLVGCVYLGVIPTACTGIAFQYFQDRTATGSVEAASGLRPVFGILLGFIPISYLAVSREHLTITHGIAIAVACTGTFIAVLRGQPIRA